jgi:hypothetical protein
VDGITLDRGTIASGEACLVRLGKWHAEDGPTGEDRRVRVAANCFGESDRSGQGEANVYDVTQSHASTGKAEFDRLCLAAGAWARRRFVQTQAIADMGDSIL